MSARHNMNDQRGDEQPGKPAAIALKPDRIPPELKQCDQWVNWTYEHRPGQTKPWTKVPKQPSGINARSSDASTWSPFEAVLAAQGGNADGIGLMFSPTGPYCGLDLDDCRDPATGELEPWAQEIVERLGTYTEVSPSGTGVKLFMKASLPDGKGRKKPSYYTGALELYDRGRYFTVTGHVLPGYEHVVDCQAALELLYTDLFSEPQETVTAGTLSHEDSELIQRAASARNGQSFVQLWQGDWSAYGSRSEADYALCCKLAFWTGKDEARMERIFGASGMVRSKWLKREDYRRDTIKNAVANTTDVYSGEVINKLLQARGEELLELVEDLIADPNKCMQLAIVMNTDERAWIAMIIEIEKRLASLKKKARVSDLTKAVKAAARMRAALAPQAVGPAVPDTITDDVEDAPVPDEAVAPLGWSVTDQGVENSIQIPLMDTPLVISERLTDICTGLEAVKLSWRRDGEWRAHVADRGVVANKARILDLASYGLPVTSSNAGMAVNYLAAFEAANIEVLPRQRISSHLGPQGEEWKYGFLWGHWPIGDGKVAFRGADAGDEQVARGYHSGGTFEEWREGVAATAEYPRVLLGLYASLATPLLSVLRAPNFIIDWSYRTSAGKTTVLRVAASCWGNPEERDADTALLSWDSTPVGAERMAALVSGLPLILDETSRARRPYDVRNTIYCVANGRGRLRGSRKGLGSASGWRTILLSTGEMRATSFTEDGGTRARVLSLWGAPFETLDEQTGVLVNQLNMQLKQHYGHAGPRMVEHIIEHREQWPEWRKQYRQMVDKYILRAGDNPVAGRYAEYFALIESAGRMAHEVLELPWTFANPVETLWDELAAGAQDADQALQALEHVLGWSYGHQNQFYGREETQGHTPAQGMAGKWGQARDWSHLALLPTRLHEVLEKGGWDYDAIVALWNDRGWLSTDNGRNDKKVSIPGGRPRMICLTRQAIDEVNGPSVDDKDRPTVSQLGLF